MTADELKKRFPNASPSFIAANLPAGGALSHTEQCERPAPLAWCDAGETPGTGCLHCRFTLVRKRLLDVDAKYASIKDLLDCLGIGHVIRGDQEGQITLEVQQRKVEKGQPEYVTIEVFEPEPTQTPAPVQAHD